MKDDIVAAIVGARSESDPPGALLIESIHDLCVALFWPDKKLPWSEKEPRLSLANIGGLWKDGEAFRLAINEQLRRFSVMHPHGFA